MFSEQILIFLVALITAAFVAKWKKRGNIAQRLPPSLPCLPLVGSLPFLRNFNKIFAFFLEKSKELGPIFTLRIGRRPVLTLNSKDAIEKAYVRNTSAFTERPQFYFEKLANPEFKGIVFKRNPAEWKQQQKLSLSILKEFGFGVKSIMETRISREIVALTDFVKDKKGDSFDPMEMCTLATANIIMNIIFGSRRDYDTGLSEVAIQTHRWLKNFNMALDVVPFVRFIPSHRRHIENCVEGSKALFRCIDKEINECLLNSGVPCFTRSYVQKAGADYDRDQLNYLLRDLVAGGTDTASTTLWWSLVALANNPDVQKRLHDEIDSVVTGDRLPALHDEANLPYVQATILELTRWRTLVPMAILRQTSRDSLVNGYFIPEGTLVIANLYAVHNDTSVWKDPDVFRPERFLDSENNVIGKENITPFSIGRRSCLGETMARAELFLIITSFVKRFLVLPPDGQDKIDDDPQVPILSLTYPKPIKIRLIERKSLGT